MVTTLLERQDTEENRREAVEKLGITMANEDGMALQITRPAD